MILKSVGQYGEIIKTIPESLEDGKFDSSFEIVIKTQYPEKLKNSIPVADVENIVVKAHEKEKEKKEQIKSLRVGIRTLDILITWWASL